jgi:isoleucyl-tRNA synthetase
LLFIVSSFIENATKKQYILMEARIDALFKKAKEYTVLEKFPGSQLKGEQYVPLFDYFIEQKKQGAFQVLTDSYVTAESGTGIVHQAAYFGADDYR